MFVDLVGSTPLSGRLDPEDLRKVVHSYHSLCVATIEAHDGFVANYQGDGILAYFGFPVAHEEDGLQAVRTGLRIIGGMPALAAALDIDHLAVRVGVHTGLVVVGEMGGGAAGMPADVVGETLNIASRVQSCGRARAGGDHGQYPSPGRWFRHGRLARHPVVAWR